MITLRKDGVLQLPDLYHPGDEQYNVTSRVMISRHVDHVLHYMNDGDTLVVAYTQPAAVLTD